MTIPRRWIVSVDSDDGEGAVIYGPYDEAKAKEIREKLNETIEAANEQEGWRHVSAYPIRPVSIGEIRADQGI